MPLNQDSGLDSGCGRKDRGIFRQLDDPGWTNYMITVIYRWRVAPGKEERSRSGWRMATEAMYWTGQPRLETDGGGGWDLLCAGPVALQDVWEARNQAAYANA